MVRHAQTCPKRLLKLSGGRFIFDLFFKILEYNPKNKYKILINTFHERFEWYSKKKKKKCAPALKIVESSKSCCIKFFTS